MEQMLTSVTVPKGSQDTCVRCPSPTIYQTVSDRRVKAKPTKESKTKTASRKEGIYIDFLSVVIVKCNLVFIFLNIDVF